LKPFLVICAIAVVLGVPTQSVACSLSGCSTNEGNEMRPNFIVKVTHGSIALAKVSTSVTRLPGDENKLFSSVTGTDGTVHIPSLPPGEYWLHSELLGIGAGGQCFHISSHPSRKAKQMVTFQWGDLAPTTSQIAGRLIDPDPGEGGALLQNIRNHVVDPIRGATLRLQDPFTGAVYPNISDSDGNFTFGHLPSGTYVLHIEGGATPSGREYEPTDILIRLTNTSTRNLLLLERTMGGAGSCGGPSLILEWPYKTI
jgi:hypothetical protein